MGYLNAILSQIHSIPKIVIRGFRGGSDSKEPACNAGNPGLIPGSGRSPGRKEMATHSSILAWIISWTEEPGGLQSMESQRVRTEQLTLSLLC